MDDHATVRKPAYAMRLSQFELSNRTAHCFEQNNVTTIGQLASLQRSDVWAWPNAGAKTLAEIESILDSVGLRLGEAIERAGELPEATKANQAGSETRALAGKIRLDRFRFSTRTKNCLIDQGIKRAGQLARLTPSDVLEWPNAGQKTLTELRLMLGSIGLSLRKDSEPAGRFDRRKLERLLLPRGSESESNVMMLGQAAPGLQQRLVSRIDAFPISARAQAVAIERKLQYLGELAQLTKEDLLGMESCGAGTVEELSALLESQHLALGLTIPDWSHRTARELANSMSSEVAGEFRARSGQLLARAGPEPTCLEQELGRIVAMVETGRNVALLKSLWGWNGSDRRTLVSVAKDYGVVRERIRQISARAIQRLRKHELDTPYLRAAIQELTKERPPVDWPLTYRLEDNAIARGPFSVRGLKLAAKLLGVECGPIPLVKRRRRVAGKGNQGKPARRS